MWNFQSLMENSRWTRSHKDAWLNCIFYTFINSMPVRSRKFITFKIYSTYIHVRIYMIHGKSTFKFVNAQFFQRVTLTPYFLYPYFPYAQWRVCSITERAQMRIRHDITLKTFFTILAHSWNLARGFIPCLLIPSSTSGIRYFETIWSLSDVSAQLFRPIIGRFETNVHVLRRSLLGSWMRLIPLVKLGCKMAFFMK